MEIRSQRFFFCRRDGGVFAAGKERSKKKETAYPVYSFQQMAAENLHFYTKSRNDSYKYKWKEFFHFPFKKQLNR